MGVLKDWAPVSPEACIQPVAALAAAKEQGSSSGGDSGAEVESDVVAIEAVLG